VIHVLTNLYAPIDPWFGRAGCPIELDMGCGKGRFVLELAARFPQRLILGSDVMLGRLRKLARRILCRRLSNVELLRANNLELVGFQLPAQSIRRVHLLCPDPWPKARHRNRRLLTTDFLVRLTRILEPNGVLHIATDHAPYLESLRQSLARLPFYVEEPGAVADLEGLKTDFELIWEAYGRSVPHLAYVCCCTRDLPNAAARSPHPQRSG
jgi:tRNA (guanine-N7-)-methyltransferase